MKDASFLRKVAIGMIIWALVAASPVWAMDVIAAGVPVYWGKTRQWDSIFKEMSQSGITIFVPDSQYVQIPEAKSLGWETDFLSPQGKSPSAAWKAMRRHGVRLLVPAECVYPRGSAMPSLATDPLRAMIKSVGRESIAGVLSFDEPITTQLPVESVRNLYLHVKQVDPTLPVYLVHAPIPEPPWNGQKDQMKVSQKYLALVSRYSQWADWVGFDIYPIPEAIAKVTSPLGGGTPVSDYRIAIADYLKWLAKNVTGKKHFLILQAFSYEDQGFPSWVARLYKARKPTMAELDQMVRISRENGAGAIGWWGQGLLDERDRKFWNQVLQTCEFASRKD